MNKPGHLINCSNMASEWRDSVHVTRFIKCELKHHLLGAIIPLVCEYAESLWQYYWNKLRASTSKILALFANFYDPEGNIKICIHFKAMSLYGKYGGDRFTIFIDYNKLWPFLCQKEFNHYIYAMIKEYMSKYFAHQQFIDLFKIRTEQRRQKIGE